MSAVPGLNILDVASSIIQKYPFNYYKFKDKKRNEIGIFVNEFEPPMRAFGMIQALDQKMMKQRGLDMEGRSIEIYTDYPLESVGRDRPSDQIGWENKRWDIIASDNWPEIDGWKSVVCIETTS